MPISPPAISIARLLMTSLEFMFDWVPEPVWKTTSGKSLVELALDDLVGGLHDQVGDVRRQLAQIRVGLSSRLLEDAESPDHRPAPDESVASDVEVLQAPLGLSAPVAVSGHFNCAHGIGFDA